MISWSSEMPSERRPGGTLGGLSGGGHDQTAGLPRRVFSGNHSFFCRANEVFYWAMFNNNESFALYMIYKL